MAVREIGTYATTDIPAQLFVNDLSEIRAFEQPRGSRCEVGVKIRELPAERQTAIVEAYKERIAVTTISRWLDSLGYDLPANNLARHLRGACRCQKT